MKILKQIIAQIKTGQNSPAELNELLWQFICYAPKMPVRLNQEQLLSGAEKFTLSVKDEFFKKGDLVFNGFKWGDGSRKIIITHGWGSKAADFTEIITALKEINNLQIFAFDAPGNGSSDGNLSNLILFSEAVKAIILNYGEPDVLIGHSLGAMANVVAMAQLGIAPSILISIAPLIRLKENFEGSMTKIEIPIHAQTEFLNSFEKKFNKPASYYNLNNWYSEISAANHWLAYDQNDPISTYTYLDEFLGNYKSIIAQKFDDVGHERIIKSTEVINELVKIVKVNLQRK